MVSVGSRGDAPVTDATHTTLREQLARAVHSTEPWSADEPGPAHYAMADAVLAVFAERERLLRERIEALPYERLWKRDVLAVFNES